MSPILFVLKCANPITFTLLQLDIPSSTMDEMFRDLIREIKSLTN